MRNPSLRALLAAVAAAAFATALSAPAYAGGVSTDDTSTTTITSPAGPAYFDYYSEDAYQEDVDDDENGIADANELVVSGTADGNEDLDLYCVYGDYGGGGREYGYIDDVDYDPGDPEENDFSGSNNAWTWSIVIDKSDAYQYVNETAGDQTCRWMAIPTSDDVSYAPISDFRGPAVGIGYFDLYGNSTVQPRAGRTSVPQAKTRSRRTHDQDQPYDYEATFPQLKGYFNYYSVSSCGICYGSTFAPSTFAQPDYSSWYYGGIQDNDYGGVDSTDGLLVDGRDGFNSYTAETSDERYDCEGANQDETCDDEERSGAPELTLRFERFDHATGDVTFVESNAIVRCDPSDVDADGDGVNTYENGNMTADNCERFVPTGVRWERRVTQNRNGQVTTLTNRYVSADGKQHLIDASQFYNEVDFSNDPVWRLPGEDVYASYSYDDEAELPAGDIGTFYARDADYGDSPEDTGSPISLTYQGRPDRAFFYDEDSLVLEYARTVPAGGATEFATIHGQAVDKDAIEALGASIEDRLGGGPGVDITGPGDGSTVSTSRVTVTGTASDNVGVDLLKVNGRTVPVASDGSWSTDVDLAEGANTITAEARDGEGQTASDAITVTYRKEAPPAVVAAAPAPAAAPQNLAGRGRSAVNLRSRRVRVRGNEFVLRIRCAPGSAQNGTIRVRGRLRGKRRNLGTEAFQCPGGATRSVDFLLSRIEERMLRRSRSKGLRMTAYIVGRDLAGEAGTFRQRFTLLPPK